MAAGERGCFQALSPRVQHVRASLSPGPIAFPAGRDRLAAGPGTVACTRWLRIRAGARGERLPPCPAPRHLRGREGSQISPCRDTPPRSSGLCLRAAAGSAAIVAGALPCPALPSGKPRAPAATYLPPSPPGSRRTQSRALSAEPGAASCIGRRGEHQGDAAVHLAGEA